MLGEEYEGNFPQRAVFLRRGWPFLWNCHWLLKHFLKLSPLMLDGFGREINDSPFGDSADFQGRNGAIGRRVIEGIYVENEAIV